MIKVALSVLLVLFLTYSIEILLFVSMVPRDGNPDMTYAFDTLIKGLGYFLTANFIVSMILISITELTRRQMTFRWWHVVVLLIICFPGSVASRIVYTFLRAGFTGGEFVDFSFMSGLSNYPSLLSAMLVYGITVYRSVAREEHENALKAEALLNDARWKMLRYQVNPHFLFNSLNSVIALINKDKELARSVVNELASYFRYTLSWNDISVISLREEIQAVSHFLEIQKIRFEDKLNYSVEMTDEAEELMIPIFGLQTLVENAVKYGLKTHPGMVTVKITALREDDFYRVTVSNTGKLWHNKESETDGRNPGTGTGLSNLKARLELLFQGRATLTVTEDSNTVTASIVIPAGMDSLLPQAGAGRGTDLKEML